MKQNQKMKSEKKYSFWTWSFSHIIRHCFYTSFSNCDCPTQIISALILLKHLSQHRNTNKINSMEKITRKRVKRNSQNYQINWIRKIRWNCQKTYRLHGCMKLLYSVHRKSAEHRKSDTYVLKMVVMKRKSKLENEMIWSI